MANIAIDMTDLVDGKPWYLSLGVMGGLVSAIIIAARFAGFDLSALTGIETDIVLLATVVTAIYGRVRAVQPIGTKKAL